MADISNASNKTTKRGTHRSTLVDLTPMVDLGFLLITFFVFTTSMSQAKAMDLIEVHDGEAMPVKESGAMTIVLGKQHSIYYYYGKLNDKDAVNQVVKTDFSNIRSLIMKMKQKTVMDELMFIVKATENATVGDNIDLLDEMAICDIPAGHYAEVDMNGIESAFIETAD